MNKKYEKRSILGDCLEVLPTLEDKSVDLVLTDSPRKIEAKIRARDKQWVSCIKRIQKKCVKNSVCWLILEKILEEMLKVNTE